MGIVLFVALIAGIGAGLMISSFLCIAMFFLSKKVARRQKCFWKSFFITALVALPAVLSIAHFFPLPEVKPGSDYDVAFMNLLFRGLGYGASPGIAAVICVGVLHIVSIRKPSTDSSSDA